jgi:hypothetical protein
MIFTEFRFLFFFLVVFLVHWGLRGQTARKLWLLLQITLMDPFKCTPGPWIWPISKNSLKIKQILYLF